MLAPSSSGLTYASLGCMLSASLLVSVVAAGSSSASPPSSVSPLAHSLSLSALTSTLCLNPIAVSAVLALLTVSLAISVYYLLLSCRLRAASTVSMSSTDGSSVDPSESDKPAALSSSSSASSSSGYKHFGARQRMKMVLCVRTDLGMTKGKMCGRTTIHTSRCQHISPPLARLLSHLVRLFSLYCTAQCCHAAVGVVDDMRRSHSELDSEVLLHWERKGAMKIALRVDSEEQLLTLEAMAESMQLPNYLVVDAGHTQVAPDTRTVLAIGPGPVETIDEICGQLKLL